MTKTLKTMTLSTALAVMFLSAGAFAGADVPAPKLENANVTIIHKNSEWPVKGRMTMHSCQIVRCIDV